MSTSRHLPLVLLALAFGFPAADLLLNKPAQRLPQTGGPVLITSDPSFPVHRWTIPGPGGEWGLVGYSQARYRPRSTDVCFGSSRASFGFSIYAVAGFAGALVISAAGFAAAAFNRNE